MKIKQKNAFKQTRCVQLTKTEIAQLETTNGWFVASNPYVVGTEMPQNRKENGSNKKVLHKGGLVIRYNKIFERKDYGFFCLNVGDKTYFAYAHIENVGYFTKQYRPIKVRLGVNERGLFVKSCKFINKNDEIIAK